MSDYDDGTNIDLCPKCGGMCTYFPCERCGDEGSVEYMDSPDLWGEDCPSEENHLELCPECRGRGGDWYCKKCGTIPGEAFAPSFEEEEIP